jgi:cytochrome c biogenesis protein CcmG, thiol:disulfide interchange protein DsbE
MNTFRRCLLPVQILALFCLTTFSFTRSEITAAAPRANADASADPPLIDLAGYRDMVAKYHGKPLLVNFWATWCGPCRDEFPMIVSLSKEYAPQGLQVVGVTLDEDADLNLVRHFIAQSHPDFPNYREKPGIDSDAFYQGVNPDWRGTMPQTDFYGRDGHLARYFMGERKRDAFVEAIRLILVSPNAENHAMQRSSPGN